MTRLGLKRALATTLLFGALGALPAHAQVTATDLLVRIDQLENQVRQLTGAVEQLQFRNQQLETSLRRTQEENEFRFKELGGKGGGQSAGGARSSGSPPPGPIAQPPAPQPQQQPYAPPPSSQGYLPPPSEPAPLQPPLQQPNPSGRRSDAFDPSQSPNAPGVPRPLGSIYASGGGAEAGSPARQPAGEPGYAGGGLPPPPPRNPNATGAQMATLPPSQSPRDEYDLAYGYLMRRDYALADQSFRDFLRKYPSDRLAADAQYGLGESLFQRQSYRDAADAFLAVTRSYDKSPRAPEALMRLGQSLAALKEKDLACGAFAEVGRKYPRVSPTVKQTVEREQKRVGC
ncbi:MAG: tol-pal system protein YbgF [Rhodoplanes sp.]